VSGISLSGAADSMFTVLRLFISVTSPIPPLAPQNRVVSPAPSGTNARFYRWFRPQELFSGTMFASERSSH
jgi:hypothetical protein